MVSPRPHSAGLLIALCLTLVAPAGANTYAVLFSGGQGIFWNHPVYFWETQSIYLALTEVNDLSPGNLTVLMSDGGAEGYDSYKFGPEWEFNAWDTPADLTGDGIPNVNYSATSANLEQAVDALRGVVQPTDIVLFWFTDHGQWDSGREESYLVGWGDDERIYASDLATWLDGFDAGALIMNFGVCYGGGFIPTLSAPGRVLMSGSAWNEVLKSEYGAPSTPETDYIPWLSAWNEGIGGAGDANADGFVSMWEAFVYARENNPYYLDGTENPQWDDPSGIGDSIHLGGSISSDPIPEPATVALMLLGLVMIWFRKSVRGIHISREGG